MAKYIDAAPLIAFVRRIRKELPKDATDFLTRDEMLLNFQQYVEFQPPADVINVVRCKDCVYGAKINSTFQSWCKQEMRRVNNTFYCAYGTSGEQQEALLRRE